VPVDVPGRVLLWDLSIMKQKPVLEEGARMGVVFPDGPGRQS
jgi:hypothetical protein